MVSRHCVESIWRRFFWSTKCKTLIRKIDWNMRLVLQKCIMCRTVWSFVPINNLTNKIHKHLNVKQHNKLKESLTHCVFIKYTYTSGRRLNTVSSLESNLLCFKKKGLTADGSFVHHYPHWVGQLHFAARTLYLCYTAPFGTLNVLCNF